MACALRKSGCLHAKAWISEFFRQATQVLHTSVAPAAEKAASAKSKKSRTGPAMVPSMASAMESKDPMYMYCWLQPLIYEPDTGWLYRLLPVSKADATASMRSTQDSSAESEAQAGASHSPSSSPTQWPKAPQTSYNVFTRHNIQLVKRQNPSKTFNEHSKILGQLWKAATQDVRDKCEREAAADKLRYAREVTALQETLAASPEDKPRNSQSTDKSTKTTQKPATKTRRKSEGKAIAVASKAISGNARAMKRATPAV